MFLDVTDYEHLSELVKEVEDVTEGQGLNLLINNAGILKKCSLDELTPEKMREVFETNTIAPLMITKVYSLPDGRSCKEGCKLTYILKYSDGTERN